MEDLKVEVVKLSPDHDIIMDIMTLLNNVYSATYSYKDIDESFSRYDHYGIYDDGNLSMVSVKLVERSNEKQELKDNIYSNYFILISNLTSSNKGRGKMLMNFILNKYENYSFFLISRTKDTISYYEQFEFKRIPTVKENHYPMIKQ